MEVPYHWTGCGTLATALGNLPFVNQTWQDIIADDASLANASLTVGILEKQNGTRSSARLRVHPQRLWCETPSILSYHPN